MKYLNIFLTLATIITFPMCASETLLRGTVTDNSTQLPIGCASITLKDNANNYFSYFDSTGIDGMFRVNVPHGIWNLHIVASGYNSYTQQIVAKDKEQNLGKIPLSLQSPAVPEKPAALVEASSEPQSTSVIAQHSEGNVPTKTVIQRSSTPAHKKKITTAQSKTEQIAKSAQANDTGTSDNVETTVIPTPTEINHVIAIAEIDEQYEPQSSQTTNSPTIIDDIQRLLQQPQPRGTKQPPTATESVSQPASDIVFFENSDDDDTQMMSVLLSSSQDIFTSIASYNFSAMRFKPRGYDFNYMQTYFNGLSMNDINTGNSPWSLWGGLNEATRNQDISVGMNPTDFSSGALGGCTNIMARASQLRQGFRLNYALSNNSYNHRVMATYANEIAKDLYIAVSASARLGTGEGKLNWATGTYYNGYSYFLSIEKRFGSRHSLAFTGFGAPLERGVQMASTQEVYDLVKDNYYNSGWGWQNGKMRNSRVRDAHEPVLVLDYVYKASQKLKLSTALGYRFGTNGYSALDWYDAPDPRPDYYRYLPSYPLKNGEENKAGAFREGWETNPNIRHVNWERLYQVNYNNMANAGISGVPAYSKRSKYVIEERHIDQQEWNFAGKFNYLANDYWKINGGINFRWNRTESFKKMKDLLGGDYWLDIDQFAERDYPDNAMIVQNDLNRINHIVHSGDKYGYDYYSYTQTEKIWISAALNWRKIEGSIGADFGHTLFYRDGLFRKGLFPDNSFGESDKLFFNNYSIKGGLNYKLTGFHVLSANVMYQQQAPWFQNAFVSPRTRNTVIENLKMEKIFSIDLNYLLRLPSAKIRISGYYTAINDQTEVTSYYDDISRTFSNNAITGIDQRHTGIELGADIALWKGISLQGAFSYGDFIYTSNPLLTQTKDNSQEIIMKDEPVYWKNFYVSNTPQLAANIGLDYSGPYNIFANINLNYYDYNYIDMSPIRRTDAALAGIDVSTPEGMDAFAAMRKQEKLGGGFILNASIGKNFFIHRKYMLGANILINNILNNQNMKSGGYEQGRLNGTKQTNYSPFDSKYYYMFGTTFFVSVYCKF